ncbi:MAG TPA: OmpA family protein [Polyangiales bacterium]|nr:OmpA family protein [Polyangiales bacterium]
MRALSPASIPLFAPVALLCACATTTPPAELLQAREAYKQAEQSDAIRYDPTSLHQAKNALDQAESLYKEDGDEPRVRDAAYVASRRAQLAVVSGETVGMLKRKEDLQRTAEQAQAKAMQETQAQLDQARDELKRAQTERLEAEKRAEQAIAHLELTEAAGKTAKSDRGMVITISGGFLFQSGKSKLLPGARPKLDEIANVLKEQGERNIQIVGYTDIQGSSAGNLKLSKARAEAVATYLASKGVPRDKITTNGVGAANPVAPNDTAEGRAANRRVEITVENLK